MTNMIVDALVWGPAVVYGGAAAASAARRGEAGAWAIARFASVCAVTLALASAAVAGWRAVAHGTPVDPVGIVMTILVTTLGWTIVRYARNYMGGEPRQSQFAAALSFTLAAVCTVSVSGNLAVLALAWLASSLGLHRLLTHYADRPAAVIVAHKKFLASRLAEACLAVALVLIYFGTGSLSIDVVARQVSALDTLPVSLHVAAVLLAVGAILKSAQLPVHGWLIQVMEAPTPVSALLHAGIVNLGGFVMIRVATLIAAAPAAQAILVVVGTTTAVIAGLVMMTRVSIKVRLAWSTCAQMGFMLMECGLGLYDLALLHLVAHSLYKAHAFLSSGEAVLATRQREFLGAGRPGPQERTTRFVLRLASAPVAVLIVATSVSVWQVFLPEFHLSFVATLIAGLGFAPLLWCRPGRMARGGLRVLALAQIYLLWHLLFGSLVPAPATATPTVLVAWVALAFVWLFAAQTWLAEFPHARLSRALHPWVFAGFYLDERFTRLTFRIWPAPGSVPPSTSARDAFRNPLPGELT